jgi:hypothetical protein
MKNTCISLLFLAALLLPAKAQNDPKHELYASYGVISVQDFTILFQTIFEEIEGGIVNGIIMELGGPGITWERQTRGTGAIGLGYNHYLSPRWTLGPFGNYVGYKRVLTFSNGNVATAKDRFYTLLLRTDYRWVNRKGFQMYSGLAAGANYIHSFDTAPGGDELRNLIPAGQVNALGLRFGNSFGVLVELGFGWNGIAAGGLSARW